MGTNTMLRAGALVLDREDQRAWLDGAALELGPKPFALLLTLMQSPQRLMTKEDLIEQVWDGRFVSEAVLTTAMRDIRRALKDDARQPTFIATAHGRGYRFMLPVTDAPEPANDTVTNTPSTAPPLPRRFPVPMVVALGAIAACLLIIAVVRTTPTGQAATNIPPSIAVLPFEDLSPERDRAFFADGLSEEILNVLLGVDGLAVASRTSAFAYRDREDLTTAEVARELGVQHVLEGTVRTTDARVRVTVRLVNARNGRAEWSRTYERGLSMQNLLSIQDEIAQRVVAEMRSELGAPLAPQDTHLRSAASGTDDVRAYELYLRSRELFVTRSDLERSVRFAREAIEADPSFARGWEMLAAASFAKNGRPSNEAWQGVNTALRLDPGLSLAHAIRGVMSNYEEPYNWEASTADLERALTLDPTNTTAMLWLAIELHKLGYLERSETLLQRCLGVDAAYDRCRMHLMWVQHMRGRTDAAIGQYRTLAANGAAPDDAVLLLAFIERGDRAAVEQIVASLAHDEPLPATVLAALRDPAASRAQARYDLRNWLRASNFNKRKVFSVTLALGVYEEIYTGQGSLFPLWLPEFPEYRRTPAFEHFVREMQLDTYWRAHGFPPQCRAVGATDFSCA